MEPETTHNAPLQPISPHLRHTIPRGTGSQNHNYHAQHTLKKAREKAQHYQNVALVLADADNQPFPQHTFDAAFAVTLLQNTPSPKATLTEIQRVSKQNAMIAVTGLRKKFTQNGFLELLNQAGLTIDSLKQDKHNREYVGTCHKTQS